MIDAQLFEVARVIETLDQCIAYAMVDVAERPAAVRTAFPGLPGEYGAVLLAGTPRPVVYVIAPLGAPFGLAMVPAVLALMAGSAVIVKPAASAPRVGVVIECLFDESLLDFPGLVQVLLGSQEYEAP